MIHNPAKLSFIMNSQYSLGEKIQLAYWLLRTKFLSPSARIIRRPFVCRGGRYVDFGKQLTTGVGCRFEAFSVDGKSYKRIVFGNSVQINDYVHISAMKSVAIGDNVLVASHVYISDNSHGFYSGQSTDSSPETPPILRDYLVKPVKIGNNVWIGEGVIIMPGTEIGDGCVIGAHSIINNNIPSYTIAVGSPARVVKRYSFTNKCWEKI